MPVIALVGRPNVGKSTLFNQLTRSRDAIVADFAGLTRDRKFGEAVIPGRSFKVVDTGGLGEEEIDIDFAMANQSFKAIDESDVVFLIVDARAGLTAGDAAIAAYLREREKNVVLVVNKVDGMDPDFACADFHRLGFKAICPVSASHRIGILSLVDMAFDEFLSGEDVEEHVSSASLSALLDVTDQENSPIKIAIVGRPNVGKSTLVNRMVGEDRVVVFDLPGTTRDCVYVEHQRDDGKFVIIDTAGIRKRKNISSVIEKFSIVKALEAIELSHVVIVVADAQEGLVEQDLHLIGMAIEKGRALIIALNKWDGLSVDDKDEIKRNLDRRLQFAGFAEIHFISALHGSGVGSLYAAIERAYRSGSKKMSASFLTRLLEQAVAEHPPPVVNGRRIKLRFAHPGGVHPPVIVVHGNQTEHIPAHYKRYLEKKFRSGLGVAGTPVQLKFQGSENPYKDKKNRLTSRQIQKKKRLMRHVKSPK